MMTERVSIAEWVEAKAQGNDHGYYLHQSPFVRRRRAVRIDRSPPRRVLAPLRWRSFKTGPDRAIWDACWSPVERLLEEGWRIARVTVDWGKGMPFTPGGRDEAIRELTGCYDACEVVSTASGLGRGSTLVEMHRE